MILLDRPRNWLTNQIVSCQKLSGAFREIWEGTIHFLYFGVNDQHTISLKFELNFELMRLQNLVMSGANAWVNVTMRQNIERPPLLQ